MSPHLKDGLYNIVPTFLMQPSPGIGADTDTDTDVGAGVAVVLNGTDQVWKVEHKENNNYYLTLERGWHSVDSKGRVMVNVTIPIGELWHLEQIPDTEFYVITRHDVVRPKLAWTLHKPEYKTPVVLQTAVAPYTFQQWFFRPVIPDSV